MSVTALAILRLIRPPGRITGGAIHLHGRDLLQLTEEELYAIRGGRIALVPQSPRSALNPVIPIGRQVARLIELHGRLSGAAARRRAIELLEAPGGTVRRAAHDLGYASVASFTRAFRRWTGMTPAAWTRERASIPTVRFGQKSVRTR